MITISVVAAYFAVNYTIYVCAFIIHKNKVFLTGLALIFLRISYITTTITGYHNTFTFAVTNLQNSTSKCKTVLWITNIINFVSPCGTILTLNGSIIVITNQIPINQIFTNANIIFTKSIRITLLVFYDTDSCNTFFYIIPYYNITLTISTIFSIKVVQTITFIIFIYAPICA